MAHTLFNPEYILIQSRNSSRTKIVPIAFFNSLLHQVREILPGLVQGASYTLEELCGEEYWSGLDRGAAILAGECMAHMVLNTNLLAEIELKRAPRTRPLEWGLKKFD